MKEGAVPSFFVVLCNSAATKLLLCHLEHHVFSVTLVVADHRSAIQLNNVYLVFMKLLSLNVGQPQVYNYQGKEVVTSIFKSAVAGKRNISFKNIEGDAQSDLVHHGGELKAVYSYDISYYNYWKAILQREEWSYGLFGENLTTQGLTDDQVLIGNIYQIGSTYLKAIQPRFPCYKLNIRFGAEDMLQQFMQQGKHGTYFSVVQEGSLAAGDEITLTEKSKYQVSIQQLVQCYYNKGADQSLLHQILSIEFLPERLRKAFESFSIS
jgi:MOSC domain-containing protein YiiM